MRFRTIALAIALSCGIGAIAEAKKPPVRKPAKMQKVKRPKARKAAKHPKPNHVKHM